MGLGGAESVLRALVFFAITILVIVTVHEFGHFIYGRIFGMRVPVFSIGFGRRLFGYNKISGFTMGPLDPAVEEQLGDVTDYRISPLPLGGYARILGMIDETQKEELPEEVQPWEFRAKPWWQKSIVISAGVIMNVLLAWAIFSGRNLFYGAEAWKTTTVGYVANSSVSAAKGVQPGDRIVSINNQPVSTWQDVEKEVYSRNLGRAFSMQVIRNGQSISIEYAANAIALQAPDSSFGLQPAGVAAVLDKILPGLPADKAGLISGDTVLTVNGAPASFGVLGDSIRAHPNTTVSLQVARGSKQFTLAVTPNAQGLIGVQFEPTFTGPVTSVRYGLGRSLVLGWSDLWTVVRVTAGAVVEIVKGKLPFSAAFGGPVKIAAYASKSAAGGFESFIYFMALLSVSLALINILPIPALDGGYLVIILIEAVIGHELSQRFKLNFQKVGFALILFLLIFMTINDIRTL